MTGQKYVAYARQSLTRKNEMDDSLSIEMQVRACREYVARHGGEIVAVFEDPDQKGWKAHRPAFDAMLARIRQEPGLTVVVFKLSRFARDLMHQERIIGEIADAGGDLASVTEPYISTAPMVRQILGAVNEQARRDQGDFLKAAFAGRARRGYHHGSPPLGYRLDDGEMVIDEPAAETIRQMFRWAVAGHGSPEITHRLNAAGLRTRQGRPWSQVATLRTLRNATYAGDVVLHGEVVASDAHPAIVTRATYDAVQAALNRRSGLRRKVSPSWLDGFVTHACGARMYCASWSADGETRWRFRCHRTMPSKRHDPDRCRVLPASMLSHIAERTMVDLLGAALAEIADPATVAARIEADRAEGIADRERRRGRIARRIDEVARQRDRLLDMTLRGSVTEDAYIDRDAALRDELATLQHEMNAVPGPVNVDALTARHATLIDARLDLAIAASRAPETLPGVLHALDVRLMIGGDSGPALQWGEGTAPFVCS